LLRAAQAERNARDEGVRALLARGGRAAGLSKIERLPFEAAATHREIQLGLLGARPDPTHDAGVLCAIRRFVGEPRGPRSSHFVEADGERAVRARRLTEAVIGRLPEAQVARYAVNWDGEQGPEFDEEVIAQTYLALLRPLLEAVITARIANQVAAEARGDDATQVANAAFEQQRTAVVEGRDEELARIMAHLVGGLGAGAGAPMLVTGEAGSGKTTLLAEAIKRATIERPGAVVITRYCGVTPETTSLAALLNDLRRTIASA
jgi:hypothetical protein